MSRFWVICGVVVLAAILLWPGCGDTYRPVVIPNVPNPPNPKSNHAAFMISNNGAINPGSGMQVDVAGDTDVGVVFVGRGPAHAALPPGGARVVVANALESTITLFTPGNAASSVGTPVTITLPVDSLNRPAAPTFLNSAEDAAMYVANTGNDSVSAVNLTNTQISNTVFFPVGSKPVALAETPDSSKVYVVNQGTSTVSSINVVDKSVNPPIIDSSIVTPVWAVARGDSARVYVLSGGNGNITVIDSITDTVMNQGGTVSVGAGANLMLYDNRVNRLYVTNPVLGTMTILNAGVDPPSVLGTINLTTGTNPVCPGGCAAVSAALLADSSQAYVAALRISGSTAILSLTAINTLNNSVTKTIDLPSVPAIASCVGTRYRISAAAAADSSRVYVASCDGGSVSIVDVSSNTFLVQLPAPVSAATPSTANVSAASHSGANTTYTYVLTSGAPLQVGEDVAVTGMNDPGNNGTFVITALGSGTFTVVNSLGVNASGQIGIGTASIPQSPVFIVAGP